MENLDKVIRIDQKPIGRTPRSNPATYTDAFTPIRQLFAKLPEARLRGYKPGRFSFNVKGGRCEACAGNGANLVEMEFLADIWVTCEVCAGRRFNRQTQTIKYKGHSIADVLDMEVEEALDLFANVAPVRRVLQTLYDVGLGYIKLGQPAPTLSGGEAQRIKLAKELCRRSTGRTLYILDEPTTGLHFADVDKLLRILHTFADQGNSVVVVEHNMEVIKTADYILDLGPEGGEDGGWIIAAGPPEAVAQNEQSHTGCALKKALKPQRAALPAAATNGHGEGNGWDPGNRDPRRESAQLAQHRRQNPPRPANGHLRRLRFGQVFAGFRYPVRRGPAPLRGVAVGVCAAVSRTDAKAQGRARLWAVASYCHRAESTQPQPPLHVGTVTEVYDYIRALYAAWAPSTARAAKLRPVRRPRRKWSSASSRCPPAAASSSSRP